MKKLIALASLIVLTGCFVQSPPPAQQPTQDINVEINQPRPPRPIVIERPPTVVPVPVPVPVPPPRPIIVPPPHHHPTPNHPKTGVEIQIDKPGLDIGIGVHK